MRVKISYKYLKQLFVPCDVLYIKNECRASCCESSLKDRIVVSILNSEKKYIESLGGVVSDGMLEVVNGKCPFKNNIDSCSLHEKKKPFGCVVSPFNLNKNNILIVRNRYRMFRCYRDCSIKKVFVYEAHRKSLELLFGEVGFLQIKAKMEFGKDFYMSMDDVVYERLIENEKCKK